MVTIVFVVEQALQFDALEPLLQLFGLGKNLVFEILALFVGEKLKRLDVFGPLPQVLVGLDPLLLAGNLLFDLLGVLGIVPEGRIHAFLIQLFNRGAAFGHVKDSPRAHRRAR